MPNKRKDGKRNSNVWLTPDERAVLDAIKDMLKMDGGEVLKLAITELAKQKGIIKDEH